MKNFFCKFCLIVAFVLGGFVFGTPDVYAAPLDDDRSVEFPRDDFWDRGGTWEQVTVTGTRILEPFVDGRAELRRMQDQQDRRNGEPVGGTVRSVAPAKKTNKVVGETILSINNGIVVGILITGYTLTFPVAAPTAVVLTIGGAILASAGTTVMLGWAE